MTVLTVQECEVCRQVVMVTLVDDREVAVDLPSREPHECFEVPPDAELLVMPEAEAKRQAATRFEARLARKKPCGCD